MDDHYKLLGLQRNASKEDIKQAFRKLALQFHPDKHDNSPAYVKSSATLKFRQINEAYEILSDDRKRSDYDIRSRNSSSSSSNYNHKKYASYNGNRHYAGASSNWWKLAELGLKLCIVIGGAYASQSHANREAKLEMEKKYGKSFAETTYYYVRSQMHKDKS